MGYWKWLKEGIKVAKDSDIIKSMIAMFGGIFLTIILARTIYIYLIENIVIFLLTFFLGLFFTATYTVYLSEGVKE